MKKIPIRQINTSEREISHQRFSIRNVQDLLGGQDLIQELHRHDFFFILALQKGQCLFEILCQSFFSRAYISGGLTVEISASKEPAVLYIFSID